MIQNYFAGLFNAHQVFMMDHRYLILFLLATFEGTITMITAGGLIAVGILSWPYALLICILAEIIDGFFWYSVGYHFGAKPIDYFVRNSPARQAFVDAVRHHANRAAGLIILAVKMTYSVTNPTLIFIGSMRYRLRNFAFFNIIGSIGWAGILLSLGYFFGQAAFYYLKAFRSAGVGVFFVISALLVLVILKESGNLVLGRIRQKVDEPEK